jgi:SHAQKYF class myb-like DNA-binding protein
MMKSFVQEVDGEISEGEEKKQSVEERNEGLQRKRSLDNSFEPPAKAQRTTGEDEDWGIPLHRSFVSAVYEVGLKHASPSVILEHMSEHPETINSERVKSHLQKYRSKRDRSKQEFMEEYDSWIQKALAIEGLRGAETSSFMAPPPFAALEMMSKDKLAAGGLAAFLSYSVMMEGDHDEGESGNAALPSDFLRRGTSEFAKYFEGARIPFPELTQEEKSSALGISMSYVMGLFFFMSQHLYEERQRKEDSGSDDNQDMQPGASYLQRDEAHHHASVQEYEEDLETISGAATANIDGGNNDRRGHGLPRSGTPVPRSFISNRGELPEEERHFTSWFQSFPPLVPTQNRFFQPHDHPFPVVHDPMAHHAFANLAFQHHAPQLATPSYVPPYMMLSYGDPLSAWAAQTFRNHGP